MKAFLFLSVCLVTASVEGRLLGSRDGHDPLPPLIGKKDGHDPHNEGPFGKPDGHDRSEPSLIGKKDGHDPHNEGPFGKPDGHDHSDPSLIGKKDGHDPHKEGPFGKPDGHDGTGQKLIGQQDGHDIPDPKLIGRPDGHDGGKHTFDNLEDYNYEDRYDDVSEFEPLVRCKRPLCEEVLSCPLGPQTDANGCATCQCLEDPCLEEKCQTGYACRPKDCPKQGPCKHLEAVCKKKKCDGPEPMCATYCPLGYQLNDRGCMTCLCLDPQNLHNLTAEGAKNVDEADDDFDEDDDYEDDDDDSLIIEDLDEHLREEEDDDNDDRDDDKKEGELCEGIRCRRNEICKADWRYPGDSENEKTNRICMIKTRCWAVANEPYLYPDHKNPDRRQSCDHTLTFEPLQCLGFNPNVKNFPKSCWCTNDLGYVINGTMTPIYAEEQKPICERNNTISATVSMKFKVISSGSGGRTIVEALTKEVSRISFAPKGSINIVNVEYPRTPLKQSEDNFVLVSLIINVHPDYDLPYALDLLFNIKELVLTSDLYVVKLIGKPTVTSYRFAYPAPPAMEGEDDSNLFGMPLPLNPLPHNPATDFRSLELNDAGSGMTKNLVIACLVVLSVLILIVLSIIVLLARRNCRRGHIRHHQLQNQMSVPIDPEQLLSDPRKNESVVLVTDDVLSKVKDSSVA